MTKNWSLRFVIVRRVLLSLILLAWMPASHAWLTTYHVGFLLGNSNQEVNKNDVMSALIAEDDDFKDSTLSFNEDSKITKLYGGFFFTQNVGVQLEYIDLGQIGIEATGFDKEEEQKFADVLVRTTPNYGRGVALSMVGRFPIWGNFVIQDWVGIFGWESEIEVNQVTATDDGVDLALGVSLEYLLTDSLSARIEWERFNHDGDGVNILGAGMTLYFGG